MPTEQPNGALSICWAPAQGSVVDTDFEQVSVIILGHAPRIAPRIVFVTQLRADSATDGAVERGAYELADAKHVRSVVAFAVNLIPIRCEVERLLLTASERPGTGAGSVSREAHANLA